jgi:tRNA(Ile)-lysidine synthase
LKEKDFNSAQVDDILNGLEGESGQQYFSKKYRVLKDRDFLFVTVLKQEATQSFWIEKNQSVVNEPIRLKFEVVEKPTSVETLPDLKDKNTACLDADKLQFPLEIRHWQEGDFFYPFGMKGRKKLSDYFIDQKFSLLKKQNAWLLFSGENVAWLVDERIDERYKIDKTTKKILKIKCCLND